LSGNFTFAAVLSVSAFFSRGVYRKNRFLFFEKIVFSQNQNSVKGRL
jgi:hypothetical protein